MFNSIGPGFVAVVGGVICLAMLAVAVGAKAQTSTVIQSAGSALSNIIGAAVSPVSTSNQFGSTGTAIGGASH